MHFESPWMWLLLIPSAAVLAWGHRRSYALLEPWARRATLALRIVLLLLLVTTLTRPVMVRDTQRSTIVFAVDVSESVTENNIESTLAEIDRLIAEALRSGEVEEFSVIAFGATPRLLIDSKTRWDGWTEKHRDLMNHKAASQGLRQELGSRQARGDDIDDTEPLEDRLTALVEFKSSTVGEHTDIERALRLAANCGRTESGRTIYLYTDASETRGSAATLVREFPDRITLNIVAMDKPLPPEVAATAIDASPSVRVNESFGASLEITSTVDTRTQIRLFKQGILHASVSADLERGNNRIDLGTLHFDTKGFHPLEAVLVADDDTEVRNNTISTLVHVPGRTRVLYVDADEAQIPYLDTALELEGMDVDARPASGVPTSITQLLGYDVFILSNVPADMLSQRQMRMIRSYVEDFGGGFVMLGGDNSFGLGGYYQTPIEEVLPVRMPIQKDLARPNLAVILVIDKSGSMSGAKIQLAKRAAIATSEAINTRDRMGVIGFDGQAKVLLELTPAGDRATISQQISALDAGGGTFLYPALEAARERLNGSDARRKHIIVLSDGQTQGFGYEDLARLMNADGITISTIGIGNDADMNLLETIALGGRAYFTNDFYSIPQIFTREALRAANNMLVEGFIQPIALMSDPATEEIDTDFLPFLTGYVATTPKASANTVLVSERGDPILARWRAGLGYAVAFTSEPKPRWAEEWLEWPDFAKFWAQLVRSVAGSELDSDISASRTHAQGAEGVVLSADVRDAEGGFVGDAAISVIAISDEGTQTELPVVQRAPGIYEAKSGDLAYAENHEFSWRITPPGQEQPQSFSYGFTRAYPSEFARLGMDTDRADALADAAGTDMQPVGQSTLDTSDARSTLRTLLWPFTLALSLVLIPIDILLRRIG